MQQMVLVQPSYVLHQRAYRDTSLLLEIFSREHGRVSAVARSARGPKSRFKGGLQQFVPLLLSWRGRTELLTLTGAESNGCPQHLTGDALLCGLYLNELLMRLLQRHDPCLSLFNCYELTLRELQLPEARQLALRLFEKKLLLELGYALVLDKLAHTDEPIQAEKHYFFNPQQGLLPSGLNTLQANIFTGTSLLALQREEFTDKLQLQDAKRLLRIALSSLLEHKPLRSRELFIY